MLYTLQSGISTVIGHVMIFYCQSPSKAPGMTAILRVAKLSKIAFSE